ncbi:MAG: hypothetical protein MUC49_19475 [Raineya sp.]|nr:hypothetical protein [Raineya sp.]
MMKYFLYVWLLVSACSKPQSLKTPRANYNLSCMDKHIVMIEENGKKEPLIFCKTEMYEFAIIWKKDTLIKEYSYRKPKEIITPFANKEFKNCFFLNVEYGDGCPTMYRVLQIKKGKAFVSDAFGNCHDEISSYNWKFPILEIEFKESPDFNKPKLKYIFDSEQSTFKEQRP